METLVLCGDHQSTLLVLLLDRALRTFRFEMGYGYVIEQVMKRWTRHTVPHCKSGDQSLLKFGGKALEAIESPITCSRFRISRMKGRRTTRAVKDLILLDRTLHFSGRCSALMTQIAETTLYKILKKGQELNKDLLSFQSPRSWCNSRCIRTLEIREPTM